MLSKLEQAVVAMNIYLHMVKEDNKKDEYIVNISKISKKIFDICSKILMQRSNKSEL